MGSKMVTDPLQPSQARNRALPEQQTYETSVVPHTLILTLSYVFPVLRYRRGFLPLSKVLLSESLLENSTPPLHALWPCGGQAGRSQIKGRLHVIFLSFFLVKRKEHLQKGCLPAVLCAVCCFWRSHHSAKEQWRASCSLGERELSRTQVAGRWPHWPGLKSPNLQVNSLQ